MTGDTTHDPVDSPIEARTQAVKKGTNNILVIGDGGQIALTLMWTPNCQVVKPYLNRIVSLYYSEDVTVGLQRQWFGW